MKAYSAVHNLASVETLDVILMGTLSAQRLQRLHALNVRPITRTSQAVTRAWPRTAPPPHPRLHSVGLALVVTIHLALCAPSTGRNLSVQARRGTSGVHHRRRHRLAMTVRWSRVKEKSLQASAPSYDYSRHMRNNLC